MRKLEGKMRKLEDNVSRMQGVVLDHVRRRGRFGATCDETEIYYGLPHQTVSPRFLELVKRGRLVRTARTRITTYGRKAHVHVLPKWAEEESDVDA